MPGVEPIAQQQSLETLYSDHHTWLVRWLRKRMNCSHHAADLAHDTYLRLLTTGNTPPVTESRRYLTRIASGLMIDLYRRRRVESAYLDSIRYLPEPEIPDTETRQLIIETLIEIDVMLDKLPTNVRRALLMRQLDGYSYREIAEHMQVSVSSVEKYVAQGLAACYLAVNGTST
ncbi:MAG: sigma-70 family RNA polymerase sigma factor [Cellvibrio sp.]|uniref:sigma-70 family RNA polymerase sigma factor n=1 Tax=Cellvibrio sp. TaxID=1965322 RepID=UPI0031A0C38D